MNDFYHDELGSMSREIFFQWNCLPSGMNEKFLVTVMRYLLELLDKAYDGIPIIERYSPYSGDSDELEKKIKLLTITNAASPENQRNTQLYIDVMIERLRNLPDSNQRDLIRRETLRCALELVIKMKNEIENTHS